MLGGGTAAARPGGLLGPRGAVGRRTVEADAETATARVAGWLEAGECLRLVRSTPDGTTTWEPRGGLLGPLRGAERQLLGEPAELRRARRTIARVRALDADTSVVELEVELSRERPLVGLGVGGIAGALAVGAALLGPLYLLLLVPLLVLGGLVIGVLAQRAEARRLDRGSSGASTRSRARCRRRHRRSTSAPRRAASRGAPRGRCARPAGRIDA